MINKNGYVMRPMDLNKWEVGSDKIEYDNLCSQIFAKIFHILARRESQIYFLKCLVDLMISQILLINNTKKGLF